MVDVSIKVPALEKLVDYTASGIGAVAGPMVATWKANKEAEAKRITAQADADAQITKAKADADTLQIIADAQSKARQSLDAPIESGHGTLEIREGTITQRIEFQERKRQSNIVSVVRAAAAELGDKEVPDHEPDSDWTARFFDSVQDVSSEEMQKIWAKILSGEVENLGRTSLRTLDTLKNMTKRDAEMFRDICNFVIGDFVFYEEKYVQSYDALRYDNLLHLQDCGLMNVGPLMIKECTWHDREQFIFTCRSVVLKITRDKKDSNVLNIPDVLLTTAGRELYRIAECTLQMDYLRPFANFLRSKNCQLSYAKVIEELPDGRFRHTGFTPIEPSP